MSEIWYFKCLRCDEKTEEGLNHGDKILLNVLNHVDTIKSLLDSDESGYIEISIMGRGMEPIDFLMEHYGEGHDVVVYSEYGEIKRVGDMTERC
jgi:hypothetical protein